MVGQRTLVSVVEEDGDGLAHTCSIVWVPIGCQVVSLHLPKDTPTPY